MYNPFISEAIEYILNHLWSQVTLEEVADHCHMSVSRFSVVFKQATGESVYAFIKRMKMEQSAIKLKLESNRDITEIGADYGYSASNFCSAFQLYHKMTPSAFRNECEDKRENLKDIAESFQQKIRIEHKPDYHVIYERTIGDYIELQDAWCTFLDKYEDEITDQTIFFERTFDDPSITKKDHCIYDICMTIESSKKYENSCVLKGGRFAVYPFKGFIPDIFHVHQQLIGVWFPSQDYVLDERYSYDQYKLVREDGYMEFDICIPIK